MGKRNIKGADLVQKQVQNLRLFNKKKCRILHFY
jgi:hypothetical protein